MSDNSQKDEDFVEKPKTIPTRKRKAPVTSIRVNHALSDNSDDDLSYSRRPIFMKSKRRPSTSSSSSSILSADDDDDEKNSKYPRPPIPTFKRQQGKKKKKDPDDPSDDDEILLTDEDYNTDVEKMDDHTLIQKTERRMLTDENLTQMTKKALEDEIQRVQRIQQRQSQLPPTTTTAKITEIVLDDEHSDFDVLPKKKETEHEVQLVFEYELNTKKPLISVDIELVAKMKPHQIDGTLFLWENIYESIEQIKKDHPGTGCILAHHMGLYVST